MSVGLPYVHVPANGGEPVFLVGDTYTVLLRGEATEGKLGVVEGIVPAKAGPPLHTHHRESETFLVTDGVLTITAGDDEYDVVAGGLVHIPQGLSHRFFNKDEHQPATMALLFPSRDGGHVHRHRNTRRPRRDRACAQRRRRRGDGRRRRQVRLHLRLIGSHERHGSGRGPRVERCSTAPAPRIPDSLVTLHRSTPCARSRPMFWWWAPARPG